MLNEFAALRAQEFSRLDRTGQAYLDHTGSALYPASAIRRHLIRLESGVFGNPHSHHGPSQASTDVIDQARQAVLDYVDANRDEYDVIFTANASTAIRLVAESFPFGPDRGLVLTTDNHNSVNGIREFATRARASVHNIPLDHDLRCRQADTVLSNLPVGEGLFAFPAQSNFSGVRHPLRWIDLAQARGYQVLLDAAALLPTSPLSLRSVLPDFVVFSIYKIAGYPTGVGALVARKASLAAVRRPWFAGGTVEYVSVQHGRSQLRQGPEAFEDGTPDFLALSAVPFGLGFVDALGWDRISIHIRRCRAALIEGLQSLTHGNGSPVVRLYGPSDSDDGDVGGIVTFNVLTPEACVYPCEAVEARAAAACVSIRSGCFCNPGAAEAAFGWPSAQSRACLDASDVFSVSSFAQCLGDQWAVGALRASVGVTTNEADISRAVRVISSFCA